MRWCALALLCCASSMARADGVNLFPKNALQSSAGVSSDVPTPLPIDTPWRAAEHGLATQFQPSVAAVTDDNPAALLARQAARRREAAPAPAARGSDTRPASAGDLQAQAQAREDQITATQDAYEEPAAWQAAEIEARVDLQGAPVEVRVVLSSGRPLLDKQALAAVRRSIGATSELGARGPVVARFRVEAGASVAMPVRSVQLDNVARPKGAVFRVASGRFGSGHKTEVNAPLQPHVRTRVALTSITPVR